MHRKSFLTATIILLLLACSAHGQYRRSLQDFYLSKSIGSGRLWKRLYGGIGKFYIPAEMTFKYVAIDYRDNTTIDTTFKKHTRSRESWTAHLGTFVPISMVSDNSMIALNVEFVGRSVSLAYDSLLFLGETKFMNPLETYMVGMPISIEYRQGGEVSLDRKDKMIFAFGGGIVPCIVNSDDYNRVKPYKFTPFIKAEIGFVAGMAFKLRGTYYLGKSKYPNSSFFNTNDIGAYDELHISTEGTNGYSFSLIISPFAWAWDAGF